jgi:hypothetical protein
MKRITAIVGVALVGSAVFFALLGHAASLAAASNSLAMGRSAVTACDTDGVSVVQVLSGANVTVVTVSGIAPACGNGSISVALNNGSVSSTGTATVPAGGGSTSVTLAAAIAMKDSDEIDVAITGP